MTKIMVDADWVEKHLDDSELRILECNPDPQLFEKGHIPGAQRLDFAVDLTDPQTLDLVSEREFEGLMARLGIDNETTVCLYGSNNNLCACHAYWALRMFGHENLCLIDGGREQWIREKRPLETHSQVFERATYRVRRQRNELRADRDEVLKHIGNPDPRAPRFQMPKNRALVDDRTPPEYNGVVEDGAGYPVRYLRGGRIPGAVNVPFDVLFTKDGKFKSASELKKIFQERDITPDKDIICYTRLGERSAVTWYLLHEVLGYPNVRNYDGAWMEWGNLVGMPVENATRARLAGLSTTVTRPQTTSRVARA